MKPKNVLKRLLTSALLLLTGTAVTASAQGHVVISQFYPGGGNQNASYTYDFVELYNPTTAAIDISGYSIQYQPATSGNWNQFNLPAGASVQPGRYYLIKLAAGTSTTPADFTADYDISDVKKTPSASGQSNAINLAGAGGRIALVNNHTVLSGTTTAPSAPLTVSTATSANTSGCPTTNVTAIVDFVGYGTANCFEATAAPAPADNVGSVIRTTNADTNSNGADFTLISPLVIRNSSYTPPSVAKLSIASTSATSAVPGNTSTLSVTVSPGSTSTGIAVTSDLTQIGGSSAQALTLSSTPNVYNYTATLGAAVVPNTYQLPVTVTDQQSGSATGTISLTVQPLVITPTPIATIQAARSTYVGTKITTTGVVTLVTSTGFYIQTPSANPGSAGVSDGMLIFSGSGKVPAEAVVGNNVTVTGNLTLFPAATASHTPSLEIGSAAVTVNSTGQPLPPAVTLPTPTATGGIYQLTKYESMRVTASSLTAVGGTDASLSEASETVTSTGQFYAVATGTARPFREPGMDFRDFPATTCPTLANCTATATSAGVARPSNLTLYDDNPERLIVESSLGGGTALNVSTGAVITNATGVIDFSYATDVPYGDPARLILEPGSVTTFTPGLTVTPLAAPGAGKFTVAAFNIERFFNTNSADDLYFDPVANTTKKSSAVDVTPAAYARRLKKVSNAVRTVLNNPDIISFEENENVSVLKDIATQIDADATASGATAPGYVAYGTDSVTTFTDDIGGISIGFLVKPSTVNVVKFEQMGANSTFTASTGVQTLNDRPSDVLHAGIKRGAGLKDYPITVISNHLRSLSGINTSADTRLKKELQAEMLANLIQGYQTNGEHVIAVGDMNAFQFSDGYTDTLGTITGKIGTNVAAQPGKAIVTPNAVDLVTTLPAAQQQSYVEWGNAQVLDHVVVTADIASTTQLAFAHIDSDFPVSLYNDDSTPAASSDHDPALAYLTIPAPVTTGTLTGTTTFGSQGVGTTSNGQVFTVTNTGETAIAISNIAVTGDFAQTNNCGTSLAINSTCTINVVFKPTVTGARTGTLTVTSNATGLTSTNLTGTGTTPDFNIGAGSGGSTSLTVAAGSSVSTTINVSSTNGFSGSITFTCAASGNAPSGVTCTVTSPVNLSAGGSASATVTFNTTSRTYTTSGLSTLPTSTSGRIACLAVLLLSGAAFSTLRRGRRSIIALALLLFALTMGVSGCSNSLPSATLTGTQAGSYVYNVTATSGSTSHTQAVTLTVQ